MIQSGYILLYRKLIHWKWFKFSETLHLFIYLLLKANFKNSEYMQHSIPRGSLVFGRKKANEDTGISERSIRTSLSRLKSTNELTIKTTNKFSIISICNYDNYQIEEIEYDQHIDQHIDQQPTSNRPATDHIRIKNKNINKRNNNTFIPPSFEEVEFFCTDHGFKNIAKKVFEYYSTADWHDSRGKKIKNWKQKLIAVWFKDENKDKSSQQEESQYTLL